MNGIAVLEPLEAALAAVLVARALEAIGMSDCAKLVRVTPDLPGAAEVPESGGDASRVRAPVVCE